MENKEISRIFSDTAKLMELHQANEFKVRSWQNAAFVIGRLESPVRSLSVEELNQIKGIGKSLSLKIIELLETGTLPDVEEYLKDTPAGVVEMMRIKGIGPKKVGVLWKDLGVESPGELLYACNENRLIELKGFGKKTQDQIRSAIEYSISNKGFFHYAKLEPLALEIVREMNNSGMFNHVELTGNIRRKGEVLTKIEIIFSCSVVDKISDQIKKLKTLTNFELVSEVPLLYKNADGILVHFYPVAEADFFYSWMISSGSPEHIQLLSQLPDFANASKISHANEIEVYRFLKLDYIEPELREGMGEVELAKNNSLPALVEFSDLRGSLHNHSTYSDGLHSLKEMAKACKDLGYEYLGICDHSKSAFYANGMNEERIIKQHLEIEELNKELAPFRIFKGIESDILHDGSLDYPDHVLKTFDFIVASIHSGLKMTIEKATERLLKAIKNPYTTILGHPTGRLLLARQGYPIDHKAVIDACAEHGVVIELNAHPYRLDLDWRWIQYALSKNVMISVNPDAHFTEGYHDMYYGVCAGRKGMLTKTMTFNSKPLAEMELYFNARKSKL
jgi:DNA polymerase (family 10)